MHWMLAQCATSSSIIMLILFVLIFQKAAYKLPVAHFYALQSPLHRILIPFQIHHSIELCDTYKLFNPPNKVSFCALWTKDFDIVLIRLQLRFGTKASNTCANPDLVVITISSRRGKWWRTNCTLAALKWRQRQSYWCIEHNGKLGNRKH